MLRVKVGVWADLRRDPAVRRLEEGPRASGVYARPSAAGDALALLDPEGETVRTLGPGSGLVAATTLGGEAPTWIVTGTDAVGLAAAAAQLEEDALSGPLRDRGRGRPPGAAAGPAAAGGAVIYERRASPLHATRAAVASAWCVLLAGVALSFEHPLAARACCSPR